MNLLVAQTWVTFSASPTPSLENDQHDDLCTNTTMFSNPAFTEDLAQFQF